MKEYRVLRMLSFYCEYLLVLVLFTSWFFWFDGGLSASLMAVILLAVPGLILNFYFKVRKEEKQRQEGKIPSCRLGMVIVAGVVAAPGGIAGLWGEDAGMMYSGAFAGARTNILFAELLYVAALGLYFFWRYYSGKYILLHRNPSVSKDTRERAGKKMVHSLLRLAALAVTVLFVLIVAVSLLPEWKPTLYQPGTGQEEEQEYSESKIPNSGAGDQIAEQIRQKQAEPGLFLVIIRYIAYGALVLFGLVAVVLILYWIITRFVRKRGDGEEYYEEIVEKNDNEEYSSLVPVRRKAGIVFPEGNDGRIRRVFYRRIKKQAAGRRVDSSQTPQELQQEYLQEERNAGYLTWLYEKARYSPDSVTDEEIARWH
ncbi:MAG: hypothetical protein J1F02_04720 [Lachnospiraceae bacterium]|nr:hypothetical protein [Lachnospiraceae bacterium]